MIACTAAIVASMMPWFTLILIPVFFIGIADSIWVIAREIAGVDLVRSDQRGRVLSGFHGVNYLGLAFGPLLGGMLKDPSFIQSGSPGAEVIPALGPKPGDLVCASRDGGGTTLENLNRGPGHCDIVVEVRPEEVHAIGGNVGDSVTRSVFPLDGNGFLAPISARSFFTVIENRLP